MIRKIKLFFGIYNLRNECFRWAYSTYGDQYAIEFLQKYDAINSGQAIGGVIETTNFLYMVEDIQAICEYKKLKLRTLYEND